MVWPHETMAVKATFAVYSKDAENFCVLPTFYFNTLRYTHKHNVKEQKLNTEKKGKAKSQQKDQTHRCKLSEIYSFILDSIQTTKEVMKKRQKNR